jgi:cytochrome c biogenesis protein CcmG, thiol:disulfide interchange protein DsbE
MRDHTPISLPRRSAQRRQLLACAATALACAPLGRAMADPGSISLKTRLLNGEAFGHDDFKGQVLLLNFWASWCAPCRAEMPEIEAVYRQYREKGLVVLALSMDEAAQEPEVREAARPYSFPVAMMSATQLSGLGRIWRMPVSAVVDRQGRIVRQDWFIQPKLDAATLEAVIKPLL